MIYLFLAFRKRIRRFIGALKALGLAGLAATVVLSGTFLFYLAEPVLPDGTKNSLFASLYWVVVTLSTVGYGDIYPETFLARIVFFYVIIFGLGIFAAAITEIGSYLSNRRFLQVTGLHTFRLKRHVVIAGYGDSTDELIQRLTDHGITAVIIDDQVDPALMRSRGINLVAGNPVHAQTLSKAGLANADTLVVSSMTDEKAVMVTLKAKELNPDIVVVSACQKYEDFRIMSSANTDLVVPVSKLQGDMLADAVVDSKGLDFLIRLLGGKDGLHLEVVPVSERTTVGQLVGSVKGRPVAAYRDHRLTIDFNDETVLEASDYLIAIRE